MNIHELEYFLSYSSNNPHISNESLKRLIPDRLEVCEHTLADGKIVELTLDRERGKMILEVYRGGDLIGEPLNFFVKTITDALLGDDWCQLEPIDIIHRVLDRETSFRSTI